LTYSSVGTYTVRWTFSDGNGNSRTENQTVVVNDRMPPSIICPANIVQNNANNSCGTFIHYTIPTCSDACSPCTTTYIPGTPISGSFVNVGNVTGGFQATDGAGNTSTCRFTITVNDTQNPVVTPGSCPASQTLNNTAGQCSATATWPPPTASDNCTVESTNSTHNPGATFPVGTTTVTYTFKDFSNNPALCSFTVTVVDAQVPVITCPANITRDNAAGNCSAVVTYTAPTVTDNCSGATTARTEGLPSGSAFPVGTTTNTFQVTDASRNTATCSFTVTVKDVQLPVWANCPGNIVAVADSSRCGVEVTWTVPTARDNCGIGVSTSSANPGDFFAVGTTTVVYEATDVNSNKSTCTFNVEVCPSPLAVTVASPLQGCGYHLACALDSNAVAEASVSGGCEPYRYTWSNGDTTATAQGLPSGTYTVTVTDGRDVTATASVVVTAPAPLAIQIMRDGFTCEGQADGTLSAMATGGNGCAAYSYLWSTGDTLDSLYSLAAGHYGVSVTDTMGCMATDSGQVHSLSLPVFSLGPDLQNCPGVQRSFTAPGDFPQYLWSTGDTGATISMGSSGTYGCTVWDTAGCSSADTVAMTEYMVDSAIITAVGNLTICIGDTVELVGDPGLAGYLWSTGERTPSITLAGLGGMVSLSATDGNGCLAHDGVQVTYVPFTGPKPVIEPGPVAHLCGEDSLTLTVRDGYYDHLWSEGSSNSWITVHQPGTYSVTVWNGFGCSAASAPVTVMAVLVANPVVVLDSGLLTTTQPYGSYQWYLDGTMLVGTIGSSCSPASAGWYSVAVVDSNGCTGTSEPLYHSPVGVAEGLSGLDGLTVYPNPTTGWLNLQALKPIDWQVRVEAWDLAGRQVKSYDLKHLTDAPGFDMSDLPAAPYILKVTVFEPRKTRQTVVRFVRM
jgi:hypothetical protein